MNRIISLLVCFMLLSCELSMDKKVIIAGDSMAYHLCADDFLHGTVCVNVAVNGSMLKSVDSQISVVSSDGEDVLVVWSGINNFFQNPNESCVDDIILTYKDLLIKYSKIYKKIVVIELLPTIESFDDGSKDVVPLINTNLQKIIKDFDNVVLLVHNEDMFTEFGCLNDLMTTDGVHLNDLGNELVWQELRNLIYDL